MTRKFFAYVDIPPTNNYYPAGNMDNGEWEIGYYMICTKKLLLLLVFICFVAFPAYGEDEPVYPMGDVIVTAARTSSSFADAARKVGRGLWDISDLIGTDTGNV
ncbi:MAG: hypothetical protein GY869_23330, partial [Planctomycetes bacterium]|nr:hypothetical protein [Planctomycetota bacterium]